VKSTGKAQLCQNGQWDTGRAGNVINHRVELIDVVKEYRKRNIPLDNIVFWIGSYWPVQSWGSHEFDPKFFPNPAGNGR